MRLGPDLAVMVRSDLATDRQPHAGTTELRLAVQTLEWRKYMVNLIGRNTDPVVGEREMPVVAFFTDAYREARCVAGRLIFERMAGHVLEQLRAKGVCGLAHRQLRQTALRVA